MTFLDEILEEAEQAENERRTELNQLRADQFLMAVKVLEDKMAEANALADEEIKIIEHFRTSELDRLDRSRKWMTFNLWQYMNTTGEKTMRLPHGILKLRKGRDKVVIENLEAFLPMAQLRGWLKKTPESYQPMLQPIHDYITRTGEIPDGVQFIPAETKFSYETVKGGDTNASDEE